MTEDLETICPFCDQHHEAVTAARSDVDFPSDGDVTLCWKCGRLCIFDDDARGGLRKPTKKEARIISRDEKLTRMVDTWKIFHRQ